MRPYHLNCTVASLQCQPHFNLPASSSMKYLSVRFKTIQWLIHSIGTRKKISKNDYGDARNRTEVVSDRAAQITTTKRTNHYTTSPYRGNCTYYIYNPKQLIQPRLFLCCCSLATAARVNHFTSVTISPLQPTNDVPCTSKLSEAISHA